MGDYRRVLRYALRHRGKIAVAVVCALMVGMLYGGSLAAIKPVTAIIVEEDGLSSMRLPGLLEKTPVQDLWDRILKVLPDQTEPDGRFTAAMWVVGFVIVASFLKGFFRFLQDYLVGIISATVMYDIRNDLYDRVIRLDLSFFSEAGVAKTMTRFTVDMHQIDSGVRTLFGLVAREPIKAVFCLSLALIIDWQLTLLSLAAAPLVGIAIYQFGRAVKRYMRRVLGHFSLLNTILQETFLGLPIVKAFSMERYESARFRRRNKRLTRNFIKVMRADAAATPTTEFLAICAVAGASLIAGWRVVHGEMKVEDFVALYALLIGLFDPARKLSKVNNRIQQCRAAARRIFEVIDTVPKVAERPDAGSLPRMTRHLAFRDVRFRYAPDAPEALRGVSLEIPAGETVAIVGHSGAGKTTLINLIPRLHDPTEGFVEIDGIDITTVTLESLRRQIALVTQQVVLFEDTVANNIAYGHEECPMERIVAAAKAANAHDFIAQLPDGYETIIGERGENLSGGQRARLAIARAVLRDPAVLILDEATANLDSESEALIQDALSRLQVGRTTIVIAHRLSTVQHADRVVVLHDGRVETEGTHQHLLKSSPIYRGLHRIQFGLADGEEREPVT